VKSTASRTLNSINRNIVRSEGKAISNILKFGSSGMKAGIIPPMRKISWSLFIVILIVCAIPPLFTMTAFSSMGYGIPVFRETKTR